MIRVLNIEGRCCPRLCCDVCKEPIEHDGMARWDPYDPDGKVDHVHKITCDTDLQERRLFWENIDTHLIYLRDNLKISKKDWKDAERRADLCESI